MNELFRLEFFKIDLDLPYERNKEGYLIITAYATRTGIFKYLKPDGSIYKEYRSPEEVFKKESMDSLKYKILTLKHPKVMVDSKNTSKYQKGSVLENVVQEGNFIKVTVLVTDEDLILKILSKELTELSCGYNCVVINQKGTSPEGEDYDGIQVDIFYNHLAVVEKGRAGREATFKLDSEDNQDISEFFSEPDPKTIQKQFKNDKQGAKKTMEITINGITYKLDNADDLKAFTDAMNKIAAENKTKTDSIADLKAENKMLKLDAENIGEKMTEKLEFVAEVKSYLKTDESDAELIKKEPVELMKMALTAQKPKLDLDDEDDAFITAAYKIMKKEGPTVKPKRDTKDPDKKPENKKDGIDTIIDKAGQKAPKGTEKIDLADEFRKKKLKLDSEAYLPLEERSVTAK